MKKTLVTLITVLAVSSCQIPNNKKILVNNDNNLLQQAVDLPLDSVGLIDKLDQCNLDETCKEEIEMWLLINSFTSNEENSKSEVDPEQMPNIVTSTHNINENLPKIQLSSIYMNNELIKGAINEWLTWKRPQLINTWYYYQFLKNDMDKAFKRYHIDEAFILAIMSQESGGKVHSRSRAGAGGLFQLMPATAKRLGLHGKIGAYDLRFNPEKSAMAAAKYISEQKNLYYGDKTKILAAYNSGETRFKRLNRKHKNKSIWDKSFYYDLPRETRHYIPVVIGAMMIFQDPQKFNVVFEKVDTDIISVYIPKKTSLSELSICLGQEQRVDGWFRIIRNLNSGIKADSMIVANTELKIPKILKQTFDTQCQNSELMQLAQSLHNADFQQTQGMFKYRVKQGDSLGNIAKKFNCTSTKELARLNNLKAPRYMIRAGKYLSIPQC